MDFFELPTFTKQVHGIVSDEQMMKLGIQLMENPEAGDLIPGGRGLRKIRIAASGRGKRGGARVIYYWYVSPARIDYCRIYAKNDSENLSASEIRHILNELD